MSELGSETQEFFLRAMAANYAGGHRWDDLDGKTCLMAADEIAALRKQLVQAQDALRLVLKAAEDGDEMAAVAAAQAALTDD